MHQKEIEWIDALDEIKLNLQRSDEEKLFWENNNGVTGNVLPAMETEQPVSPLSVASLRHGRELRPATQPSTPSQEAPVSFPLALRHN
jgi:hypothetical protein